MTATAMITPAAYEDSLFSYCAPCRESLEYRMRGSFATKFRGSIARCAHSNRTARQHAQT